MRRYLTICVVCFGSLTVLSADETQEEVIVKARHLTEAAVHLRAAGRGELADKLRSEAEELLQPVNQKLQELQAESVRLQDEVAALEKRLGRETEILVHVRMLSTSAKNWAAWKPITSKDKSVKPVVVDEAWLKQIAALEAEDIVKQHVSTTLCTQTGIPASLKNGGEFPIPVPNQNGGAAIQWRDFGVRLNVLPAALGFDRVALQLTIENSTLDLDHAVTLNGTRVPGLNTQKIQTDCESRIGQTVLVYQFQMNDEVIFGLVTPDRANDAAAQPGAPALPKTDPPAQRNR